MIQILRDKLGGNQLWKKMCGWKFNMVAPSGCHHPTAKILVPINSKSVCVESENGDWLFAYNLDHSLTSLLLSCINVNQNLWYNNHR